MAAAATVMTSSALKMSSNRGAFILFEGGQRELPSEIQFRPCQLKIRMTLIKNNNRYR